MWSIKNLWLFRKKKVDDLSVEKQFLAKLAHVASLAKEKPVLDGASLVIRISNQKLVCDIVIEVRLPGWINWIQDLTPKKHGSLWVYIQNISDEPLNLHVPEFILVGGLQLPWKVGLRMMANFYRGEHGEVLLWEVLITGNEDSEFLASEIVKILNVCRKIVDNNRPKNQSNE